MTDQAQVKEWASEASSLTELVQRTTKHAIPMEIVAEVVSSDIWERQVPAERVKTLLREEREHAKQYESIKLNASARAARYVDIADLDLLSGVEFEHLLAAILSRIEGEAEVTGASGDQGLDVVWQRPNETIGIQAKAYDKQNSVDNSAVQEIYTGADVRGADYSIDAPAVVTTSSYTTGAREAADTTGVALYGRPEIREWLKEAELDAEMMGDIIERL